MFNRMLALPALVALSAPLLIGCQSTEPGAGDPGPYGPSAESSTSSYPYFGVSNENRHFVPRELREDCPPQ